MILFMTWLVSAPMTSKAQFMGPYIRTNLSLAVIVKYPEQQLTDHGLATDLFIVGNGLGLSWSSPEKLEKISMDTWHKNFLIEGSPYGHRCQDCADDNATAVLPLDRKFEFRINTDGGYDMVGANYGLRLPVSKMSSYFEAAPTRYIYPHFFTFEGTTSSLNVSSDDDAMIATRNWGFYLPPSFFENTYKRYPIALAFDLGSSVLALVRGYIDDLTVKYALADEAVFIGSEDYRPLPNGTSGDQQQQIDRIYLLTPTVGVDWVCYDGGDMYVDGCGGCIPPNVTDMHDRLIYMRDGCGYPQDIGGKGDAYVDYWIDRVVPAVNDVASGRLLTDRYHTAVGGCSLGGLMACHALWTRPDTFYAGACQSSSFWWPTTVDADNGFDFLNVTLRNHTGPRAPQRVYIDVTDLEDDPYYRQVDAALLVADTMVAQSPQFVWDATVTLSVVIGQKHGGFECLSRLWLYDNKLFPAQGGPRNPLTTGQSKLWSKDGRRPRD